MKKGISANVPHTYIADGIRYFGCIQPVEITRADDERVKAYNFYIFDAEGYCWLHLVHTTRAFIFSIGNGILKQRILIEVENTDWTRKPTVPTDDNWIQDIPDRGYALETLRGALGLDLTCLTQLIGEPENGTPTHD